MLGRSHAMTGALGWLAVAPLTGYDASEVLIGTALAAGAATLPDLDEPGSTVSRALGPVTQLLAVGVRKVAGGHRELTHTLLGAVAFGGLTWILGLIYPLAALAVLGVAIAVGLEALGVNLPGAYITECVVRALIAVPLGALAVLELGALPCALIVSAGCAMHCAGDWLTLSGVPFLHPLHRGDLAAGLFRTGGGVERGLVFPVLTLAVVWLAAQQAPQVGLPAPDWPSVPAVDLPAVPSTDDLLGRLEQTARG